MKVSVNTRPVADQYAGGNEKIIEFSSPQGGGLISFQAHDDGTVDVLVYRHDESVTVMEGKHWGVS